MVPSTPSPDFRLGLIRKTPDPRNLKLAAYLASDLPAPPTAFDPSSSMLGKWGIQGNHVCGDCVEAGMAHMAMSQTAQNRNLIVVQDSATLETYSKITGYVRGEPSTDNGTYMQAGLNYWRSTGIITQVKTVTTHNPDGSTETDYHPISWNQILGYMQADVADHGQVKLAAWLFGGCLAALNCPTKVLAGGLFTSLTWDVSPTPGPYLGGHCVPVIGYNSTGPIIVTWGRKVQVTWAFWDKYFDEGYAVASQSWISPSTLKAPSGFDIAALQADLAKLSPPHIGV